ncbi:MAG: HlyD family efflux transporter periplasmic adaptor subunit [Gammaproteobacteria bacterium]|nr:HlyD family efflux transporter periplasmic adaptor subunit [Gammaproteobacteria bacterium]
MKINRATTISFLVIIILALLVWGFWPTPLLIESGMAKRAPLRVTVEEEGQTRVKDRFVISAPVAGYLQRITLEVGDAITRGQTLALMEPLRPEVLDPRSRARAEAQVAAAQASIKRAEQQESAARAAATYARNDYARKQQLQEKNLVSREVVEQAATHSREAAAELRSAGFAVEVARHELEAAETALQFSIAGNGEAATETVAIKAPINSRVLQIHHKSEGVLVTGEPLLEIGDPAALEVAVDVLSADAVRIRPGTRVQLLRWGGPQSLDAVVRTVEPTGFTHISALGVEEQRVWVIADLVSPRKHWEQLGDGYRVEAHFILWEAEDVLQIPTSALFRQDGSWAVFVIDAGKARLTPVSTGQDNGLITEVLDGLAEGAWVILHPDDRIEDGVRVTAQ